MVLIKCNECGKEISDKAEECPGCGCPLTSESNSMRSQKVEKDLLLNNISQLVNSGASSTSFEKGKKNQDSPNGHDESHECSNSESYVPAQSFVLLSANVIAIIVYVSLLFNMIQPTLNRRILYESTNGNHGYIMLIPLIFAIISMFRVTRPNTLNKVTSGLFYMSASIVYLSLTAIISSGSRLYY